MVAFRVHIECRKLKYIKKNLRTIVNIKGIFRNLDSMLLFIKNKILGSEILPGIIERTKIQHIPRKTVFSSKLIKKEIWISDSFWYLPTLKEIWENQIYKFQAKNDSPLIIDCGANIGLSVIYWKYLYPKAKIIAFEPDPNIFKLLEENIAVFNFESVDIRQNAIWSSNTKLNFKSDNSVGGRISDKGNKSFLIKVDTFRLRDLLNQNVDMLKIDIEGAEDEVLFDCKDQLTFVDKLFVEYHGNANEQQKLHEILELLQNAGFRYHIKEANPVKHPFVKSELGKLYDLQLNIYAFRN